MKDRARYEQVAAEDGWSDEDKRAFEDRHRRVAESLGMAPDETDWAAGFVNPDPAPQEAIDYGRFLAARYGW